MKTSTAQRTTVLATITGPEYVGHDGRPTLYRSAHPSTCAALAAMLDELDPSRSTIVASYVTASMVTSAIRSLIAAHGTRSVTVGPYTLTLSTPTES